MKFVKMHGLGNDFIIINNIDEKIALTVAQIRKLANRNLGIGFDQCLILSKATNATDDFLYKIYNADGSEVGQCGNGARCAARYLKEFHHTTLQTIKFQTITTSMSCSFTSDNKVKVDFPVPKFAALDIPIKLKAIDFKYTWQKLEFFAVNVGNPHAILNCNKLDSTYINRVGAKLAADKIFPEGCNIGFMKIENHCKISLRVFERGAGETQACGSGAVAAAIISNKFFKLASKLTVVLLGGEVCVDLQKSNPVLIGSANFVFEGEMLVS